MNDEQFEATMDSLRDELAARLSARDTAQREALARVEAELAEAVGLLGKVLAWPAEECTYGQEQVQDEARAFLVRHAQAEQQEAQSAQAGEFQREDRYIVIKRNDLRGLPGDTLDGLAKSLDTIRPHLPKREYLVIESDWPEYEPTWMAIQTRVVFAERRQVRDASEEEKQAIADRLKGLPTSLRGNDHDQ